MRGPDRVEEEGVWLRWLEPGKGDRDRGSKYDSLDGIGVFGVVLGDRGAENSCFVLVVDGVGAPHADCGRVVREFVPDFGGGCAHETNGNDACF